MTINTDLAKKWVAALRSGNYVQGQNRLRNSEGKYCCLGVLCEVAGITRIDSGSYKFPRSNYMWHAAAEDSWWNKQFGTALNQNRLWQLNDTDEKSFAEIADYIEQELDLKA